MAGVLAYWLEEGAGARCSITSIRDGIWWAVTTVTTINSPLEPVTFEGRAVALMLRLFGLGAAGYLTAVIAVFLLGKREAPEAPARQDELHALREEVQALKEVIRNR